jgi:hypothetical protein
MSNKSTFVPKGQPNGGDWRLYKPAQESFDAHSSFLLSAANAQRAFATALLTAIPAVQPWLLHARIDGKELHVLCATSAAAARLRMLTPQLLAAANQLKAGQQPVSALKIQLKSV